MDYLIEKKLIQLFYAEIKKLGAEVDENKMMIYFRISLQDTERWLVEKRDNDKYRIKWSGTSKYGAGKLGKFKCGPTAECEEQIKIAVNFARKNENGYRTQRRGISVNVRSDKNRD